MASFLRGLRSKSPVNDKVKLEEEDLQCDEDLEESKAGELEEELDSLDDLQQAESTAWESQNTDNVPNFEELSKTAYPLNAAQLKLVEEVRRRCKDELERSQNFEEVVSDRRIIRFLRGHKFNLDMVCEAYKKMLNWRLESGADAIRERIVKENLQPHQFPHYGRIHRYYPSQTNVCSDDQGRPVHIELLGNVSPKKMLSSFSEEEWITFHVYACEYNAIYLDKLTLEKSEIARMILIYDLKGCGTHHLRSKKGWALVKRTLQVTQDFYPETMHQAWLLNASKVFALAWQLLKPCLAERTVKKIQILRNKDVHKLFRTIPKSGIPVSLGGTKEDAWPLVFDKDDYKALDDEHKVMEVGKGSKNSVKIQVEPDSFVVWGFYLKSGDITATVEMDKLPAGSGNAGAPKAQIAKIERTESSGGSFEVISGGDIVLTFDNSFSWITKKKIFFYVVSVHKDNKKALDSPRHGKFKSFFD